MCNRDEFRDILEEANRSKDKWQEECHIKEDDHDNQANGHAPDVDVSATNDVTAGYDSQLNSPNYRNNNRLEEQEEFKLREVVEYKKSTRSSLVLGYLKQVGQSLTLHRI